MRDELMSFEEGRWSELCVTLAAEAAREAGSEYSRYVIAFSEKVDKRVALLPEEMRVKAIQQAERWDYASATQRAIDRNQPTTRRSL
ncbi:MAG: hypothetical protein CVU36_12410 [Betaproteobacteria bacterium HGW-Betaproteobacteria-9]|jgi:hypothetical protein|nr:MAG: hypothetical protein CVU36_12410 [Betaproteobacteria bacterium HGW-Betaproteobacteria-9]PKO78261.1 MAG: hypothetical protein CVU21_04100 [Betaproteobacteria bacterium HGW-Betaproteobacteria-15]